MVRTLKNLLQNGESFEPESWYIASGNRGLPSTFDSPYLENNNFETCAPRMFKLHAFGGLPTTKKC